MSVLSGRCLALIVLLIAPLLLHAETQQVFRLSPDNGLSQGHINRLLLDQQHQLWLATDGGLDRFDGYRSRAFVSEQLPANTVIYDLFFPAQDRLLLATSSEGLLELDLSDGSSSVLHRPNPELADYSDELIYLIRPDITGDPLYADSTRVLTLQNGLLQVLFTLPSHDIHLHYIRDLLAFDHYLLIASSQGLWLHDRQTHHSWQLDYLSEPNRDQLDSKALAVDEQSVFVGTVEGLYALNRDELAQLNQSALRQSITAKTLLSEQNIWRIQVKEQQLLLGTNQGLLTLDLTSRQVTELFRPGRTRYAYFDDSIVDFIQDQHGNFWLGTRGDGAYYWQPNQQRFSNIINTAERQPLSHPFVYSLVSDKDSLWAGTQNGLNRLDLQTLQSQAFFVNPDPKATESEASFYSLIGANNDDGLWLMNPYQIRLFSRQQQQLLSLPEATAAALSSTPYSMAISSGGALFVHNEGGFFVVQPDLTIQPLDGLQQAFHSDWASHWVAEHPDQPGTMLFYDNFTLWAVHSNQTAPQALYQLPQGYRQSSAYVEGVQAVGDSLWLLIHGLGLVELDRQTLTQRQLLFGGGSLPTTTLYQLEKDDAGMLWMSSHSGLWRFNPKTGSFRQFTSQQGLAYNEFNGLSGTRLADGRLAFGSTRGISLVNPADFIEQNPKQPTLRFSELSLFSRTLPPLLQPKATQALQLRHDDYGLGVHVSTFSYRQQADTLYQFELTGPSRIPAFESREPYLLLPQLRPGNYLLSVRAFDAISERYSEPAQLSLQVAYSPWQSPLARVSYLFLLMLMLLSWLLWRQQQKRRLIQQNRELQQSQQRLQLALDIADSDVWSWSATDNSLLHPKRLQLLGLAEKDGFSFEDYASNIHPDDQADYLHGWKELCDGLNDHFQQVYRVRDAEQKWHWFKDIGRVTLRGQQLLDVSGIYTNITAQKLTEQELEHLIHFDSLTQLPNRNNLLQQIDALLQTPPKHGFSLLFIDLDRFKHINDSMGHEHGNTLLQIVAARLQSQLQPKEILAHLGSDEFVYVMLTNSMAHIAQKSDALHSLIAKPVMLDQQLVSISCSIGIACYPQHGKDSYELLKFADIAMAYAKKHGDMDYAIFEHSMPERTKAKMQLEYQLKQAIQRQQLQNYYQPIVDSQQQKTIGVELLLRWSNDGKMIPPDQFIPMAEELDLMAELTWGSLQKALHDLQRWHQLGLPLYLSVNLSASQLSSELLASRLSALIEQEAIDPAMLRLEITESSLMKNRLRAIDNMHRLKALGVQLYLDDFGTGYSSLTYLKDFPIDLIKIDRSFVSDVQAGSQNAILNTIIALARNMQLPCIAEGVETEYQLNYLQQQGCHFIQGYWYSPPLPKERLEQFLLDEQKNH
ncbi:EAL domain-containing protein [Alkalimonas amylolytica]|uniref:Diguanylate cyclase (GGDEF) domain-containing protein n=1 Tax=Alkalimonas amylolytica TaxID=152573 RepID=A0A1H3ZGP5_ALKAM|nr:EAL domain-containing protein [Alkalimonas amylolytica]SEA22959.1 diguanylate cyclase (GGDEF) domain-containing protein [Alkalimonas amylolytica]